MINSPPNKFNLDCVRQSAILCETPVIFIPVGRSYVRCLLADIIFIEAVGNYVKFHTYFGAYLSIFTIRGLVSRLPSERFCKVNRGTIINIAWVIEFNNETIILANGEKFSFGEGFYKEIKAKIEIIKT